MSPEERAALINISPLDAYNLGVKQERERIVTLLCDPEFEDCACNRAGDIYFAQELREAITPKE